MHGEGHREPTPFLSLPALKQLQISNDLNRTNICCTLWWKQFCSCNVLLLLLLICFSISSPLLGSSGDGPVDIRYSTCLLLLFIIMAFGCRRAILPVRQSVSQWSYSNSTLKCPSSLILTVRSCRSPTECQCTLLLRKRKNPSVAGCF